MDTKSKGDIAEQAAILQAMKRGWAVLKPLGDRLPYDLVFDVLGRLVKVQVKSAWYDNRGVYYCDTRRTKTNRREMRREVYSDGDFDFALIYVDATDSFYVMPLQAFTGYASSISLQCTLKRQRQSKAEKFLEAWDLIEDLASPMIETTDGERVLVPNAGS